MNPLSPHKSFMDCLVFPMPVIIVPIRCFGGKEAVVWDKDVCN